MSHYRALVIPQHYDPLWGDFHDSLRMMESGMRDMDRLFGNMNNQFLRLQPRDSSHQGRRAGNSDIGFPDVSIPNPVVTDSEGKRHLNYKFDVRQFKPEEINIKSYDDNRIEVSAKHESKDDDHHIYREYRRVCSLPKELDLNTVKSQLHPDGILSIEAPLPDAKPEKIQARNEPISMQIEHQGNGDVAKK